MHRQAWVNVYSKIFFAMDVYRILKLFFSSKIIGAYYTKLQPPLTYSQFCLSHLLCSAETLPTVTGPQENSWRCTCGRITDVKSNAPTRIKPNEIKDNINAWSSLGWIRRSAVVSGPGEVPQRSAWTRAELHGRRSGRTSAETSPQVHRHSHRSSAERAWHQRRRLPVSSIYTIQTSMILALTSVLKHSKIVGLEVIF